MAIQGDGRAAILFLNLLIAPLKSASRLEAENATLRQRLAVLQRKVRGREPWLGKHSNPEPQVPMLLVGLQQSHWRP